MKKYISPEIEAIVLHTAEDCLTLSVCEVPDYIEKLDFNNDFEW